ncbi:MAG: guanine deaminase [Verrucomicrobiales bacterium]
MLTIALRLPLLDSPSPDQLRFIPDGALVIQDCTIAAAGPWNEISPQAAWSDLTWQTAPGCFATPGLIDTHLHLPQLPAIARPEASLLPWLQKHIFPLEKTFTGPAVESLIRKFFSALIQNGTSTAVIYLAVYEDSAHRAFEIAEEMGLRVVMGKVMMDRGSYGDLAGEHAILRQSLEETERLIQRWHNKGRSHYAVSPRFAISCSQDLMRQAAALADTYQTYVQTHLSENHQEIQAVTELFPWAQHYVDVYDQCGLLHDRTLLGHAIHLSSAEVDILRERRTVITHCPSSNLFLRSGIMPLDRWRAQGLRLSLASDVAGGPELNLWQVARTGLDAQQARAFYENDTVVPKPKEMFHLATRAGAEALGWGERLGLLQTGHLADFAIWHLADLTYGCHAHPGELDAETLTALLIYRGGPQALKTLWIDGQALPAV